MKTIINTIIFSICFITFAQNPNLTPFTGNWEWENGNQTFKVEIYVEDNYLKGHYQLTETNYGIETVIYHSNKLLNEELDFYYGNAIFGKSNDGVLFYAQVNDNVQIENGHNIKIGNLAFTIINDGSSGSPMTASWEVTPNMGLKSNEEPEDFSIPTDITLTKVD